MTEMTASSLLSCRVLDDTGRALGFVRDVRLHFPTGTRPTEAGTPGGPPRVVALVIGGSALGHAWGLAAGRLNGPRILVALSARGVRNIRVVPIERVVEWAPDTIRIRGTGDDLPTWTPVDPR